MNKNRVFETVISSTNNFYNFALPKDARMKVRTAKVGAGVVILPDTGADITDSEIVKALGLKDVEPEEERTKIIIDSEYHEERFCVSLTDSQIKLLEWLDIHGLLNDWVWDTLENVEFEEI